MPISRDLSWQNIKSAASSRLGSSGKGGAQDSEVEAAHEAEAPKRPHPARGNSASSVGLAQSPPAQSSSHLAVPGSLALPSRQPSPGPSSTSMHSSSSLATMDTSHVSSKSSQQPLAFLRVQVLRAYNLTPKDRNGKADPFVVVSIPGLAALTRKTPNANADGFRRQTSVVHKSLEPEWKNEVWDFEITNDWFGPSGWQQDSEEEEDEPEQQASVEQAADAMDALGLEPTAAAQGAETPSEEAPPSVIASSSTPPSRPPSRRKLSATASKVLSTSAKGMKLLPKGAAAGARAVARGTPRPMQLRRAGGSSSGGVSRLGRGAAGLVSNLEIVVWDKDFARREYMGEATWPVWEWCRAPRKVEWDDDESQGAWLSLVSSRRSAKVSGQVEIRLGLVPAPGSPVKSLEKLYRSLVAAALGARSRAKAGSSAALSSNSVPRGLPMLDATEDQIRLGVRAVPASLSVGTAEKFYEDDGFSTDEEEEERELLDSESDEDEDDDELDEDSDSDSDDDITTTEDELTTTEGELDSPGFLTKHKERLQGQGHLATSAAPAPSLPVTISSDVKLQQPFEEAPAQKRKLFGVLGKKSSPRRESSPGDDSSPPPQPASADVAQKRRSKKKAPRRRRAQDIRDDLAGSPDGESKEERRARRRQMRQERQGKNRATRRAKQARRRQQQDYSFKPSGDIVGIVMMEVKGAQDLPRWRNSIRTGFDMDPFTIVSFGQKVFRTRVLRHTLNPTWDEKLLFHVHPHELNYMIKMSVYDWDKISANDHVGSCELPLAALVESAPKADPNTGLYGEDITGQMQNIPLPLFRAERDEDVKYGDASPVLTVQAKFTPYAALRQRFWRQLCQQFDTNDSGALSALELTSMLDSLGSTLTTETIHSFFTRHGKSAENDEITFGQAIIALEDEIQKPINEKRRINLESVAHSGAQTPALTSLDSAAGSSPSPRSVMDMSGHSAAMSSFDRESSPVPVPSSTVAAAHGDVHPSADKAANPPSVQAATVASVIAHEGMKSSESSGLGITSPSQAPSRPRSAAGGPSTGDRTTSDSWRSGTSADVEPSQEDHRPVERVIQLKSCPLCHMPRLSKKGDGDVVTHLAVCASQDWRRVDSMVVANFVTASQAHRKWFNKVVITATQGRYKLGANSANLIIQDRATGELLEEKMQVYVRLGIRLLYQGARSRMEGARIRRMLKNMSVKQGKKYDSPASVREIPGFIAFHNLNVDEIREPLESFKTFNEFFYRKLKQDARPVTEPQNPRRLVSAADCRMMAFASIDQATTLWIKGREFSVERLLGDTFKGKVDNYLNGSLCIFRLAPQDYHRFHCPADAVVGEPTWIDGQYYTVNPMAIRSAIDVYGENVRVVVPFHSEDFGTFYAINIGAMMVGSIVLTVKAGQRVKRGDEMGYYAFGGSTTVCVFEKGRMVWDEDILSNSQASIETLVKQGTGIGRAVAGGAEP